jgi:hypothetical protein
MTTPAPHLNRDRLDRKQHLEVTLSMLEEKLRPDTRKRAKLRGQIDKQYLEIFDEITQSLDEETELLAGLIAEAYPKADG